MSKTLFLNRIETLSCECLVLFLIELAFNLSITARNTYQIGSDDVKNPKALRGINEIIHRVLSQARNISYNTNNKYQSDIFIKIIFEIAINYGCIFELENAIIFSIEKTNGLCE